MPDIQRRRRGYSKADWLKAGLEMLRDGDSADLRIESVAKALGVSKSGFYWHFRDREDLVRELLRYWSEEFTDIVAANAEVLSLAPKERLTRLAHMILDHGLGDLDMAIRLWARSDKRAAETVLNVNRKRLNFVRTALVELGFEGDELEMRTMLFACYHTWETSMYPELDAEQLRHFIDRRIDFLTSTSAVAADSVPIPSQASG